MPQCLLMEGLPETCVLWCQRRSAAEATPPSISNGHRYKIWHGHHKPVQGESWPQVVVAAVLLWQFSTRLGNGCAARFSHCVGDRGTRGKLCEIARTTNGKMGVATSLLGFVEMFVKVAPRQAVARARGTSRVVCISCDVHTLRDMLVQLYAAQSQVPFASLAVRDFRASQILSLYMRRMT